MAEKHPPLDKRSTIKQSNTFGFYLLFASLALASVSGLFATQAHFDYLQHSQAYLDIHEQVNTRRIEAQFHRARGGISSAAMIEEAARDAPPRDVGGKRLALSIALTKNGTGFEDRFVERAKQNASDEELTAFRNSFLTSLFESSPTSLRRQEVIQMHMDVLTNELAHAARLTQESEILEPQAQTARAQASTSSLQSQLFWKALILLMMSAVISLATLHYHLPWLMYLSSAFTLYGGVLLVRAFILP